MRGRQHDTAPRSIQRGAITGRPPIWSTRWNWISTSTAAATTVRARLALRRNPAAAAAHRCDWMADGLTLLESQLDGAALPAGGSCSAPTGR